MRVAGGLSALLLGTAIVIVQPVATALTPSEIANIAQQITVRIDGANTGSGVIIERQGNVYTVVTNWHVVQLEGNYIVQTPDGQRYTFNNSQVKRFPGVDLAVFQFTSNQNYRVAAKGNSDQITLGTNISVAGYPQGTSDIDFRKGAISRLVTNPKDGYAFVYDIGGFPGMSGGAILDEQGKLVGIHGRATTRPDTNATTVLGIPLRTYLRLAPSVQPVKIVSTPTPTRIPKPLQPTTSTPVNLNNSSSNFVLAKTLNGHLIGVKSVAFSPDGRTLASGGDSTIKIWNIATGQVIRTLDLFFSSVNSVAFSPDGRTLASGGSSNNANANANAIKIWNITTGQLVRTLNGHSSSVYSVAFSPDGRTLASDSRDKTIKIWNIATGKEIRTFNGHSSSVNSVAFSPDGRTLASGSYDKTIKIWNVATGKEIRTLNGHSESVSSVAISSDGRTLASGSYDNTIKIWNVATGKEIRTLDGHSFGVNSVAISPDGRILASGSGGNIFKGINGHIKIWRLSD